MPNFEITASETVIYKATIEADSEQEAIEKFEIDNSQADANGFQIETIKELKENGTT